MADDPYAKFLQPPAESNADSGEDPYARFLTPPPEAAKPQVGSLEAFGRGAAQAFGLGYSPEVIAAAKTGHMVGSDHPEYTAELAKQKASTNEAWNQHPWLYGTGMAAAAVPSVLNAIFAGPEEAAAVGGAGLLAESGNIGSLAGAGLRGLAGGSELAGKAASVLENPLAQGAIYGSSEGDTVGDKLSGAVSGAIGAKVAPALLGAAGTAIGNVGSKIAPEFSSKISQMLKGGVSDPEIIGAMGDELGIHTPAVAASDSSLFPKLLNSDPTNAAPKAAAMTSGQIGNKLADLTKVAGTNDIASSNEAGEAIRNSINNWKNDSSNPNGFAAQLAAAFKPANYLSKDTTTFAPTALSNAVDGARKSSAAMVSDIEPTLGVVEKALSNPDGLTFDQLHALRISLDDQMNHNGSPGSARLNDQLLQSLRSAVDVDMHSAAYDIGKSTGIGGQQAVNDLATAESQAAGLYNARKGVMRIVGNPNMNGTNAKTNDQIYNNIVNSASNRTNGPNVSDLTNLSNVVNSYDPNAWHTVAQAYTAKKINPQDQGFSFNNFNKNYTNGLHPAGKNALFASPASADLRGTLNKLDTLGNYQVGKSTYGNNIDQLSSMVPAQNKFGTGAKIDTGLAMAEMALLGGLPIRALGAAAAGAGLGQYGARNISAPISKQTLTPAQQAFQQILQKSAPLVGAQANPIGAGGVKAAAQYGLYKGMQQLPPSIWPTDQHASGGRIGRKSGGRATGAAKAKADQLIAMVDRIKKDEGEGTKPLLNVDDTTIAKALEIANRGI